MGTFRPGEVLVLDMAGLSVDPGAYVVLAVADAGAYLCPAGEDDSGDLVATGSRVLVPDLELGYFRQTGVVLDAAGLRRE
jgi:hypothetical protein